MLAQRYWQMQQTIALDPVLQAVVSAVLAGITAPDNASIAAILLDTGTTLPAQIDALSIPTPADVAAIKAKTDALTFTVTGQVDANAKSMNGAAILGTGASDDLWRGE